MKRSFASLFAVALVATLVVVGCGGSETVSRPDTSPPLAPVVLGARGSDGTVGLWWRSNTEPDLAGYNVYKTEGGLVHLMTLFPVTDTFLSWADDVDGTVGLYVTAVDWTGNESSPSATKMVSSSRDGQGREAVEGLLDRELAEPR